MGTQLRLEFVIEAIDNATKKIREVNAAVEKANAPMRTLRNSARELFKEAGWDKLRDQMGRVRERAGAIGNTIRAYAYGFGLVTAAAGGVFYALDRTVSQVDHMNDVSKKLGMSVESYQKLGYAAELNGSSQEEMGQALQFLSQSMVEAISGSKETQKWFAAMGITVDQLRGRKVDQVFELIADKFQLAGDKGQNAAVKISIMRALMGRSGAELKQVLDLGSKGLREFYAEAERLGVVIDGRTAEAMSNFDDGMKRLRYSIFAVTANIAKAALPALQAMIEKFTAMNVANRMEWGQQLGRIVSEIVPRIPGFLTGVGQLTLGLVTLLSLLDQVAQALGGWGIVINTIAALLATKLVVQFGLLMASIVQAIPTLTTLVALAEGIAIPFIGLAAAFSAAAVAAIGAALLIWKYWEPISNFFSGLWEKVKQVASIGGPADGASGAAPAIAAGDDARLFRSGGAARADVSGTLRIVLDSQGRPVGAQMEGAPGLQYDIYTGMPMAGY